mgnify:CR=1 FL=1
MNQQKDGRSITPAAGGLLDEDDGDLRPADGEGVVDDVFGVTG